MFFFYIYPFGREKKEPVADLGFQEGGGSPWKGACGEAVLGTEHVGRRSLEGGMWGGGHRKGACGEVALRRGHVGRWPLDGGVWGGGP